MKLKDIFIIFSILIFIILICIVGYKLLWHIGQAILKALFAIMFLGIN